jgi:2-oxoglutarate dehydrogenase E2 component (dihydrolipoamide succinyltransferase)
MAEEVQGSEVGVDLVEVVFNSSETSGSTAILLNWNNKINDFVNEYDEIAEIETDKVTIGLSAPVSGVLVDILKWSGDDVSENEPIAVIRKKSLKTTSESSAYIQNRKLSANSVMESNGKTDEYNNISTEKVEAEVDGESVTTKKLSNKQRLVAKNVSDSLLRIAPHVTTIFEVNLTTVINHRKVQIDANPGLRLTYIPYFLYACARAVEEVPELNSHFVNDILNIYRDVNIGLVVALDNDDLIVPVVYKADKMDLRELLIDSNNIISKAKENSLDMADVENGTITLSSYGGSGSLFAAPIVIKQPQVAAIGIGKIENRIIATGIEDGKELSFAPKAYVTLTIDHRVVNGSQANRFMERFCQVLENWL